MMCVFGVLVDAQFDVETECTQLILLVILDKLILFYIFVSTINIQQNRGHSFY